ncbi:MAG: PilN domain-containing protein [Methylobacter sp.]|uniref:PilN domain-containing protein n=1 Tax=Methylobacter sp. TaxID=2051955 RepID=UPI0027292738|nr:PilN domain-containing protein [Methylobacter sp.]MDO9270506.1 PilN domain-containing protein [Methylobacter sp.]MDP1665852.1 PilN domain-containing protein [Methylobacter sp.]
MIQQVNLYQDILNQGRNKSGINLYWISFSVIALLFVGFSGHLMWSLKNTETQIRQFRQNLEAEQTQVNIISSKIPKQDIDAQLTAEVAQWQNMLDELTQTIHLLSDKSTDQSPGFSSYFQALSNQSIPDVWLSALYLDGQQQVINIEGSTFKPEKIPYFLQQLQKEPIFNGYSFARLIMQQSETMPNQMDFKLSTTLDTPDKKDHAQ